MIAVVASLFVCIALAMLPRPVLAQSAAASGGAARAVQAAGAKSGTSAASSVNQAAERLKTEQEASAAAAAATIAPGTKITMANWRKYKQFMPDGMIKLFQGTYFWKMPPDVVMNVGPTQVFPAPRGYLDATEKYGNQTRVVVLPNGHYDIQNYIAGEPFPNPTEPHKGWKILADDWFGPIPRIAVGSPETGLASLCTQDRFGNSACIKTSYVYRQLAFITDPGYPRTEPGAHGAWYTEWSMIEEPEQSKYTAVLQIFYQDLQRPEADYVFVPALRRSLRLASTARCSPLFGTDYTHDDARAGFNGNISIFQAHFLRDQKILAINDLTTADGTYPANYDMPLGWAKPSWGRWSLRETYVIDVRRIPSEASGYCYGKRIMWVDKYVLHEIWTDLYDSNMKLWKIMMVAGAPKKIQGRMSSVVGTLFVGMWDMQNDHSTLAFTADGHGGDIVVDNAVPKEYEDITRYCTPAGLMQIMR
jgi:hypothetical protein